MREREHGRRHDAGRRWARHAKEVALVGSVLAILGLLATLFVKRRRLWVRARRDEDGATVLSIAGLTRQEYEGFEAEMNDFWNALTAKGEVR